MKQLLFLAILVSSTNILAQDEENCFEYMNFPQNSSFTDTITFSNNAKLYYLWNCDSTWLTFENEHKVILKSCPQMDPMLCARTQLNFIKEYPHYLLFIHKWISGCCTPPDLVFVDKVTGLEKDRILNSFFVWGDSEKNYALYFSDTTYSTLIYLDHLSQEKSLYGFKENQIPDAIERNDVMHVDKLFDNFQRDPDQISFDMIINKDKSERIVLYLK